MKKVLLQHCKPSEVAPFLFQFVFFIPKDKAIKKKFGLFNLISEDKNLTGKKIIKFSWLKSMRLS